MLINLRTLHKPATLEEAVERLARPDVYPLYGSGASLIRLNLPGVEEAVDLTHLVGRDNSIDADGDLHLGAASTLENICVQLAEVDATLGGGLSAIIRAEVPETLRNTLTLGDVLLEHNANSLLLTLLAGLHTDFSVFDAYSKTHIQLRIRDWFGLSFGECRQLIVTQVSCREYAQYRYAFEKLGRTPSDAAIVGAVAFARPDDQGRGTFSYVCGLTDHPARYVDGMQATLSDYKGSAEYRAQMARVLSERAVVRAMSMVR